MPPPGPGKVYYKVEVGQPLGEHVTSVTPSRTLVESKDANKTVTLTASFDRDYELDCFTVDGQRINGNTFGITDHSVTVSAIAKKAQSDMERWKEEIKNMVAEYDKNAKARLGELSAADRAQIEDLAKKVDGISKGSFKTSVYGATATASSVSSSYTASTIGVTGFSFVVSLAEFGVDGAFLARVGYQYGMAGVSSTASRLSKLLAARPTAVRALANGANANDNKTYGVSSMEVASEYLRQFGKIHA